MNLSPKTLNVLKNFSSINPSLLFTKGNELRTVNIGSSIMATAIVEDYFEKEFAIYNLSQFINSIVMFNNPTLDFGETSVTIIESDGNKSIKYHYTEPSLIVSPKSNKKITLPSVDANFTLTHKNLQDVTKALGILGLLEIAIEGDGSDIFLQALDIKNNSSNLYKLNIGHTDKVFRAVIKPENLKMIAGDYNVSLCAKGFSQFIGENIEYVIALEATSTFS